MDLTCESTQKRIGQKDKPTSSPKRQNRSQKNLRRMNRPSKQKWSMYPLFHATSSIWLFQAKQSEIKE
jgi:hypothetical protein